MINEFKARSVIVVKEQMEKDLEIQPEMQRKYRCMAKVCDNTEEKQSNVAYESKATFVAHILANCLFPCLFCTHHDEDWINLDLSLPGDKIHEKKTTQQQGTERFPAKN